ncbi:MAG: DNA-processing protein DprA [Thermoanaerobaculia bacterium]
MLTNAHRRDLLIALNAEPTLQRASVCALALRLDAWVDRSASAAVLAAELAVPGNQMKHALAVVPAARRVARRETERAVALGVQLLTFLDDGYPRILRDLTLPPPVLYVRGVLPQGPAIAIVGSRQADPYGREAAEWFARELAAAGLTVVSGFARGVDLAAHHGALAADGATVAVLGCGVDVDYPQGRTTLKQQIVRRGGIVSELPLGAPPLAHNFPVRNRIIAALAAGTLVVQAVARSGSLITARLALELGRDVYAVPGPIFHQRALGPNALIRDGAIPALHPQDILDSLPTALRQQLPPATATPEDEAQAAPAGPAGQLLRHLRPGDPRTPERLAAATNLPIEEVLTLLLELELDNRIRRHPGPSFSRKA